MGEKTLQERLRAATDPQGIPTSAWNLMQEAAAELDRRPDGWLPIESAPKDGTNVLGGVAGLPRSVGEMFWWEGGWRTWDGENHTRTIMYPTHWLPLPTPPLKST